MKILYPLILLFITFFSAIASADSPTAPPQSSEVHLNKHHEKSRNATVKVTSQYGHGTGTYVKIGKSYGVLTAAHVVENSQHYIIEAGLHQSIATLIWSDEDADIAFLITEKIDKLSALKMTSYPDVLVGELIIYSGFPSSHEILTFSCQIANPNHNGLLVIQGWAWFGSSGSGFINKKGKVFAVLSAVSVESFYGHPQVLETLVYGAPLRKHMLEQIEAASEKWEKDN
jgi:hypothetical protein